jgi:hypothetical protein
MVLTLFWGELNGAYSVQELWSKRYLKLMPKLDWCRLATLLYMHEARSSRFV